MRRRPIRNQASLLTGKLKQQFSHYYTGAKEAAILCRWRLTEQRPRLGRRRMYDHLRALEHQDDHSARNSRLLVHVAFHFVPSRLQYVREAIDQVSALPFDKIDIVIDTNSKLALNYLVKLAGVTRVAVWQDLEDPFKLTWMHREGMLKLLHDYDFFMYIEDDLLIPQMTISRWRSEVRKLSRHGFIPGFARVEENNAGALVLSDFRAPVKCAKVIELEGAPYLINPFPYQACWIYEKAEMLRFAASPSYANGAAHPALLAERDGDIGVRESVAVGAIFDDVPAGLPSRALLPLTSDFSIPADALIFHMPSNYGRLGPSGHPAGLGTVELSKWRVGPGQGGEIEIVAAASARR